jgi:hypothetical protein
MWGGEFGCPTCWLVVEMDPSFFPCPIASYYWTERYDDGAIRTARKEMDQGKQNGWGARGGGVDRRGQVGGGDTH